MRNLLLHSAMVKVNAAYETIVTKMRRENLGRVIERASAVYAPESAERGEHHDAGDKELEERGENSEAEGIDDGNHGRGAALY